MSLAPQVTWRIAFALVVGACGGSPADEGVVPLDAQGDRDLFGAPDGGDAGDAPVGLDAADAHLGGGGDRNQGGRDGAIGDARADDDLADATDGGDRDVSIDARDALDTIADAHSGATTIGERCFPEITDEGEASVGPAYDPMDPVVGDHCWGTAHQEIEGVERVVVLGDSVAQGTPNIAHPLSVDNQHFWRNKLAEWLAGRFDLDRGDAVSWGLWKAYDYVNGTAGLTRSGDFWNCAKWGARTDDFIEGGAQLAECFPDGGSDDRTLVVFTMGGNDVAKITREGGEASAEEVAAGYPEAWALAHRAIDHLRDAMTWLKDPARFPNGSHVVFANPFEFTDGTGEVDACPAAGIAGLAAWEQPEVQAEIVIWILEEYMRIATETDTDLIWMMEHFCGHGWVATGPDADPEARCYRGPDTERWFDETCIHPNDAGHDAIFRMFRDTIAP